jgi:Acetyl-CoA carboxylase, carboxyltransferase component (subunits alpha and beta)
VSVQATNGVIDILVDDEAEGVAAAKQYLSYFQGRIDQWACADQRLLRQSVPENRLRAYDIRSVIDTLADAGSVLELRPRFGIGMITAFIRIEGRPLGLIANNRTSRRRDRCRRRRQGHALHPALRRFDIPVVSLCDTPA